MNIFEYLNLPADHRKNSNKVTQLVKHWDDVTDKNKQGKTFAVQMKRDGVCAITIVKQGYVAIYSRTGKRFANTGILRERIALAELRDGIYLGEMLVPKSVASLEELSGVVNPNRTKALDHEGTVIAKYLEMHFFDLISIESFIEGASQTPFSRRFNNLAERLYPVATEYLKICPVTIAKNLQQIEHIRDALIEQGEEGIVIRDLHSDWIAGHKGYRAMKMVRGVDYDLRCIGYEEGTGKYEGKVANLIFQWKDGETIKCMLGKGWTHEAAAQMLFDIVIGSEDEDSHPIGKIFQVYALEESSKGKLRLPKVGEMRHDKEEADV
jgi:ATP-dependent DNA ligase